MQFQPSIQMAFDEYSNESRSFLSLFTVLFHLVSIFFLLVELLFVVVVVAAASVFHSIAIIAAIKIDQRPVNCMFRHQMNIYFDLPLMWLNPKVFDVEPGINWLTTVTASHITHFLTQCCHIGRFSNGFSILQSTEKSEKQTNNVQR